MRSQLPLFALGLCIGCADSTPDAPAKAPAEATAQKATTQKETRKTTKKKSKRTAKKGRTGAAGGVTLDVPALNQARADHVGKVVTVQGFMLGTTSQGKPPTQLNVAVGAKGDIQAEDVLCVAAPDDQSFKGIRQYTALTVKGTVAEKDFFGDAMLEGCTLVK